jgi:hypothetical protein
MSTPTRSRLGRLPGMGAFCVGIAFILASTVLNIAHDRLSGFNMDKLPLYIGDLYVVSGKLGVTILLVSLGVLCLILGACLGRPVPNGEPLPGETLPSGSQPYFVTGQSSAATPTTHSSGRIVLETWKYVTPSAGTPNTQ